MPKDRLQPGMIVRHFKGGLYLLTCFAIHTENGEELAIYISLNAGSAGKTFARPKAMLLSEVDRVKYPDAEQKYRFEEVKGV